MNFDASSAASGYHRFKDSLLKRTGKLMLRKNDVRGISQDVLPDPALRNQGIDAAKSLVGYRNSRTGIQKRRKVYSKDG